MAHTLPPWAPSLRKHQVSAIRDTVDAFISGERVVMLDAPPGAGKTLIAEIVRQELEARALYVCTTHTLMEQFRHDFPHAAFLKGRSNYPTLNFPERFTDPIDRITAEDCDKSEGECTFCHTCTDCPYEVDKVNLLNAHLGCTNTAYFLSEANFVGRLSKKFPLVIVDEADTLEHILMGFVEVRVSQRMRKQLNLPLLQKYSKATTWAKWLEDGIDKLDRAIAPLGNSSNLHLIRRRKSFERLQGALGTVHREIVNGGWIRDGESKGEVVFRPLQITAYAKKYMWDHAERFLLMSGTFISPDHYAAELDLPPEHTTVPVKVSYPPSQRPVRIAHVAPMTYDKQEESWPKMAGAVEKVMGLHPDDRILVHTVSYGLADYLVDKLASPRIVTYTQSSQRQQALRDYENLHNAVLIAPSMDRGVSLDDELCRAIIIAKIPYPSLADKQINQRAHGPGGDIWYKVQTIRTLVQMLGRGMRSETDQCTSYILDSMFGKLWKDNASLIPDWTSEAIEWGGGWKKQILT